MADVVVSLEPVRVPCHPTTAVIDRFDLWRNGVHAVWIGDDGSIEIRSVRAMRGERPWVVDPDHLDWKRDLYEKIAPHLAPATILSSNTSGL